MNPQFDLRNRAAQNQNGGRKHMLPGQTSIWELPEAGPTGGR